jgi:hypothetical protein
LMLLMLALVGAVLLQLFIRSSVAPHHRWVSIGRPRVAVARRSAHALAVESRAIGDWENEGGAVAVPTERLGAWTPIRREGPIATNHAQANKPKVS